MAVPNLEPIMPKTILHAKELNFYYGRFHALKNINLNMKEHQITALIGPSGCGKSTFLRTLNRMNDLISGARTEGHIYFRDYDITQSSTDSVELRKQIGMVFQQANPFYMSIYENVAYGLRIQGVKKKKEVDERVEESLRAAALWDEVKDNLGKSAIGLSGGQQQRLVLARVLAVRPEVILMDEPTSALDPISTAKLEQLMVELKEKYTIIIVTHNMQQAARISDETAFFLNGEVMEFADTNSIFTNPTHQKTEEYISGRFG